MTGPGSSFSVQTVSTPIHGRSLSIIACALTVAARAASSAGPSDFRISLNCQTKRAPTPTKNRKNVKRPAASCVNQAPRLQSHAGMTGLVADEKGPFCLHRRRAAGNAEKAARAARVGASFRAPRGPHAEARLRADARGGDGSVRQELAAEVVPRSGGRSAFGGKPENI